MGPRVRELNPEGGGSVVAMSLSAGSSDFIRACVPLPRPPPPGSLLALGPRAEVSPRDRSSGWQMLLLAACWEYKGDGPQGGALCVHLVTQAVNHVPPRALVWCVCSWCGREAVQAGS